MKNHHCPDKSGRRCLLRLGEYEQVNVLSYSTASKERWCLQRWTGAAAPVRSAPKEAVGLSAQPTSLPGAGGKPEPRIFGSNWTFPCGLNEAWDLPKSGLTSLKTIIKPPSVWLVRCPQEGNKCCISYQLKYIFDTVHTILLRGLLLELWCCSRISSSALPHTVIIFAERIAS